MGKKIVNQIEEMQSPLQDKPKERHVETHTNQANILNTKQEYQKQQRKSNK